MKNSNASATQSPEDLLNDLRALVAEAEKMIGNSSGGNDEAVGSLRQRYEAAQERLTDFYEGARQKVVAGAKTADEAIRENPYQSLAIALGVGVLVGVLVGRRNE